MKQRLAVLIALMTLLLLSGCGGDYNGPKLGSGVIIDITPPYVMATSPQNGATNVSTTPIISVTFSETVNSLSINTGTFTLTGGGLPVAGTTALAGTTAIFTPSAALLPGGVYTATISGTVTDIAGNAMGTTVSWSFTTGATLDTTPPTVNAASISPANLATNVSRNTNVTAVFSETVQATSVVLGTFLLSSGGTATSGVVSYALGIATFNPTYMLAANTTYTATITTGVMDLANNAMAAPFTWTFTTAPTPTITTTVLPDGAETVPYSQTLAASGGMTPYTWSTSSALPTGISLSTAGVLSGTPGTGTAGIYTINVTLMDADGVIATKSFSLTVIAGPLISTTTLPDGTTTGVYPSQTLAVGGGTAPYSWAVTTGALPTGLSLSTGGVLSGTITAGAGSYPFTVTVTDNVGATDTQNYTLLVNAVPSITTTSLAAGQVGIAYGPVTLAVSGGTGTTGWSATGLPGGLIFDTLTGTISGTPAGPAGTASVDFTFTDAYGVTSATATLALDVIAAPLISTATLPEGTTTGVYTAPTLTASGGTLPYSWSATGLPAGLSLSTSGDITGTITDPAGSYTVNVTLTDTVGGTDTKALTLNVNAAPSITTASPLTAWSTGVPTASMTFAATGGTLPLTWTSTPSPPDTWLTLTPGGDLSGTEPSGIAGTTYTFDITVTDANGVSATGTFNLVVQ